MERVINLLYDIEEKANQIVKRANEEKAKLHEKLQEDMETLDKKITADNALKLEQLKVQAEKELNQEMKNLTNDCIKHIAFMDEKYQKNHTTLTDKIVNEVINS